MAVDYFASGVFGYELTDDELAVVEAAADAVLSRPEADAAEDFADLVRAELSASFPKFLPKLRRRCNGKPGDGTGLHHTGLDDDRPGRCATEADTWIYGIGLFAFGRDKQGPSAKFRAGAS